MSKDMKILQKSFGHDLFHIEIAREFHTLFNQQCTNSLTLYKSNKVFIIKVVIIFQMVIFHLKILKKYRCVDALLSFQRIMVKVAVHMFLGWLNLNLLSVCENSKWWIQYGGQNFEKCSELDEIVRTQVFGVAESKSAIKFSTFEIVDRDSKNKRKVR